MGPLGLWEVCLFHRVEVGESFLAFSLFLVCLFCVCGRGGDGRVAGVCAGVAGWECSKSVCLVSDTVSFTQEPSRLVNLDFVTLGESSITIDSQAFLETRSTPSLGRWLRG